MKLTWVCPDGTSVIFSKDATDYILLKTNQGFADPSPRFQTAQGALQNGATLLDTKLDPKDMSFDITMVAADYEALQALVARLTEAFNPLNGPGYLFYEYENGTSYYRQCIGNGAPLLDPSKKSLTHQDATIPLRAFDPFWHLQSVLIPITAGATSWIPWFAGSWIISGWGGLGDAINLGSIPVSCKIRIYGDIGTITNPKITKVSTGEYIKVEKVIGIGESFIIDTDENILSATFIDSSGVEYNGYPYLAVATTFFKLDTGNNEIQVTADTATPGGYVTIEKSDLFVGR